MVSENSRLPAHLKMLVLILLPLFYYFKINAGTTTNEKPNRPEVCIGVLALRGNQKCINEWTATADYLNRMIPHYCFRIEPLGFDEVFQAAANGTVDFFLTNPAYYISLEMKYGGRRIATLSEVYSGKYYSEFGGVIFTRADNENINSISDLRGKSFMAVDPFSFGGWFAAKRELLQNGFNPDAGFSELSFGNTHDKVVYAVLKGQADAGTVRTGNLEQMQDEGKIDKSLLKIINKKDHGEQIPFDCSTMLYPEWPFSKARKTSQKLAKEVSIALLQIDSYEEAALAAGIGGWTIPENYEETESCLRELKAGPYVGYGELKFIDVFQKYWPWVLLFTVVPVLGFTVSLFFQRRRLWIQNRLLQMSENRLRILFANSYNAIFVIDLKSGEYLQVNHAAEILTGRNANEIIHRPFDQVGPKNISGEVINHSGIGENHYLGEVTFTRPDGTSCVAVYSTISINGDTIYGIAHDITQRKENEREIQLRNQQYQIANQELKQSIEKVRLINLELEDAKNRAEESERLKTAFLANISHEIRTPMNGILGFTHLLKKPAISLLEQEEFISIIERSGERLLSTINDLIDISKIESNQLKINAFSFNLNNQMDELYAFFSPETSKINCNLHLSKALTNEQAQVFTDQQKVFAILTNLIKNAIKYSQSTDIYFGYEELNGSMLSFFVKDIGLGIDEELQDVIFERFIQGKTRLNHVNEGSGLGLAISKAYTELLGGSISLISKPGEGAEFRFILPRHWEGAGQKVEKDKPCSGA